MRMSDWSSDVCSSDLLAIGRPMRIAPVSLVKRSHVTAAPRILQAAEDCFGEHGIDAVSLRQIAIAAGQGNTAAVQYHFGSKERSEEHTSEPQSLMRISYAVCCLKKKNKQKTNN